MGLAAVALLAAIRAYKVLVSPYLSTGVCRFTPSCSDYAAQAIAAHGSVRGGWLAARRLARCRPWGGHGFDPIPQPGARSTPQKRCLASQGALDGQSPAAR